MAIIAVAGACHTCAPNTIHFQRKGKKDEGGQMKKSSLMQMEEHINKRTRRKVRRAVNRSIDEQGASFVVIYIIGGNHGDAYDHTGNAG